MRVWGSFALCLLMGCPGVWAQGSSPSKSTIDNPQSPGYLLTASQIRQMTQALVDLAAAEQQNVQLQNVLELQRKNAEAQAEVIRVKDASLADKDRIIALERQLRDKVEQRVVQLEDQVKLATKVIKRSWIRRAGSSAVTIAVGALIGALLARGR